MKVVIGGIDPGTQSAFALLDLEGNLIKLYSERNVSSEDLIRYIAKEGKIVLIGSDVTPVPKGVKKVASALGARLIEPERNLQLHEKIKIVDVYLKNQKTFIEIQNKHEKDALCAALCSFKRVSYLFKKIDDTLKQRNLEHLSLQVKENVLIENISINNALRDILSPPK